MKTLLLLTIGGAMLFSSCDNYEKNKPEVDLYELQYFGDSIIEKGSVPGDQLFERIEGKDSLKIKLSGIIEEVCQKKGCWMVMNIGKNKTMRVRFKDYAFFIPKDASGREVILEGVAFNDTTTVEMLKHYAEDAGKSKEEINKITKPEINIGFEANGVIIKK